MTQTTSSSDQPGSLRGLFNRLCIRAVVFVFMPNAGTPSNNQSSLLQRTTAAISQGIHNTVAYLRPDRQPIMDDGSVWAVAKNYTIHGIYVAGILIAYLPSIAVAIACALRTNRNANNATIMRRINPACIQSQRRTQASMERPSGYSGPVMSQSSALVRSTHMPQQVLHKDNIDAVSQLITPECLSSEQKLEKCPICLDCIDTTTSNIRVLACSHGFHAECIDTWLTTCCALCPLCKTDVGALV